jgi:hypothetical protein
MNLWLAEQELDPLTRLQPAAKRGLTLLGPPRSDTLPLARVRQSVSLLPILGPRTPAKFKG